MLYIEQKRLYYKIDQYDHYHDQIINNDASADIIDISLNYFLFQIYVTPVNYFMQSISSY